MQFIVLIEGVGLLFGLVLCFLVVLHARRFYWDTFFTIVLLALTHLYVHVSSLAQWGYGWTELDLIEDYVQVLEPLLWCFVLYSFIHHHITDSQWLDGKHFAG